jgi:carbonic anhydrase
MDDKCDCCACDPDSTFQNPTILDEKAAFSTSFLREPGKPQLSDGPLTYYQPRFLRGQDHERPTFRVVNSQCLCINGSTYRTSDFHIHCPAEHYTVDEEPEQLADATAELHVVTRTREQHLCVVAFRAEVVPDQVQDTFFGTLLDNQSEVSLPDLLDFSLFIMPGSRTSKPYMKPIQWIIAKQKIPILASELKELKRRALVQPARALQPLNNRMVLFVH